MPWRVLAALVFVALILPSIGAEPNVDVLWPKDLDAPTADRAGMLVAALAIDVRYVLNEPPYPQLDVLKGTGYDGGRSAVAVNEVENGSFFVDILHPGGLAFRYEQGYEQFVYTIEVPSPIHCVGESQEGGRYTCTPDKQSVEERSGRLVQPSALRPGISFGPFNRVTIEGPPATFESYGTGFEAAQAIAESLGIP